MPEEVWQVVVVALPVFLPQGRRELGRPRLCVCARLGTDQIVAVNPWRVPPEEETLALRALYEASGAWRCRPGRVEVVSPALAEKIRERLGTEGVPVEVGEPSPEMREILDHARPQLAPVPDLLSGEGVTLEGIAAFARAAERFFSAAPWRFLSGHDLIRVELPRVERELRFLSVGGAAGLMHGLMFFPSTEVWEDVLNGEIPFEVDENGTWSISFEPDDFVPAADLALWEREGLPRAGGGLIPVLALLGREAGRRPDVSVIAFLEGLMKVLAVATEEEVDRGRWETEVDTCQGPLRFVLALPALLEAEPVELCGSGPEPPELRAWEVLEAARQARGRRQIQLARRALEIWPDCADAYGILGDRSPDPAAALAFYEQGVAAGERAMAPELLADEPEELWLDIEARPYMRARLSLAETLRELDRREEAAQHLQDLLRLNFNDHQGVRYILADVLLELGRDQDVLELLERYPEDASAAWVYTQALVAFRLAGDSPAGAGALEEAFGVNRFIPEYLLGDEPLPLEPPSWYSFGDDDEAQSYVLNFREVWLRTPGALDWLEERWTADRGRPAKRGGGQGRKKKRKKGRRR